MDDFNDLDKEIAELRKQISESGQSGANPLNGYWHKRMDEEKKLWEKKLILSEEEKKLLEERLAQQKAKIDQYGVKMTEMERNFENETKKLAEMLRTRETDLLIEKNRALWEEKVKYLEEENKKLQNETVQYSGKIGEVQEERRKEAEKIEKELLKEKEKAENNIREYLKKTEVLQERIRELENKVWEKDENVKVRDNEISHERERENELKEKIRVYEKEKEVLSSKIIETESKKEHEKKEIEESYIKSEKSHLQDMAEFIGLLHGFKEFGKKYGYDNNYWGILSALLGKMETEVTIYREGRGIRDIETKTFNLAYLAEDNEASELEKILSCTKWGLHKINKKYALTEIERLKPRITIVSLNYAAIAEKIKSNWPFMPVVMAGNVNSRQSKRAKAKGILTVSRPYSIEDTLVYISVAANKSISCPQFWNKLTARKRKSAFITGLLLAFLTFAAGCFTGYLHYAVPETRTVEGMEYSTPYTKPTNITYDGKYLWTCDWFTQSIYKNTIGKKLEMVRIFYFPGKYITALTFSDGYLWSSDPWKKTIYKHNLDAELSIIASYPAPGESISGLAYGRDCIWSCDSVSAKIFKHKLDDKLSIESSYASPGKKPAGIYFDGRNLWTVDSKANKLYRHAVDDRLSVTGIFVPPDYEKKGYQLSGITGDGKNIWICSEKLGKIFKYPIETLKASEN